MVRKSILLNSQFFTHDALQTKLLLDYKLQVLNLSGHTSLHMQDHELLSARYNCLVGSLVVW
jgi:hypothetical protein